MTTYERAVECHALERHEDGYMIPAVTATEREDHEADSEARRPAE